MMMLVADKPGPIEQAQDFYKRTAGAETNVAIGLTRLGLKVGGGSSLGADTVGRYLLAEMHREGIDCSHVICDPTTPPALQVQGERKSVGVGTSESVSVDVGGIRIHYKKQ